jgi:hypothetical protein
MQTLALPHFNPKVLTPTLVFIKIINQQRTNKPFEKRPLPFEVFISYFILPTKLKLLFSVFNYCVILMSSNDVTVPLPSGFAYLLIPTTLNLSKLYLFCDQYQSNF